MFLLLSPGTTQYNIVVWVATGFVGQLVAEHLVSQYPTDELTVALGGRNQSKRHTLATDLARETDSRDEIPTVIGDATEPDTLREIASQIAVVCTTVGPYTTGRSLYPNWHRLL